MRNRIPSTAFVALFVILSCFASMTVADTPGPDVAKQDAAATEPDDGSDALRAAQARIAELEASLADAEEARRANLGKIEQLDHSFASARQRGATLQSRLEESESALATARAIIDQREIGLNSANDNIAKLEAALATNKTALAEAGAELIAREASLTEIQGLYDENAKRLQVMARRLESAQNETEAMRERLAKGEAEARARIESLEATMRDLLRASLIRMQTLPDERTRIRMSSDRIFMDAQTLISPEGLAMLTEILEPLRTAGMGQIRIEVHDDRDPSLRNSRRDRNLSRARADALAMQLSRMAGIPLQRISANGDGDSRPIASNSNAAGRALNRRVEIYLPPTPVGSGLMPPMALPPAMGGAR
ncbi:MAG: OmpA family protein [Gammaproteobacteria bacterium]|nr:OmpA family protein [Gammaproteobacteria bacterium]